MIFRPKRGDGLKILVRDGSGLAMVHERLDGGVFAWPAVTGGAIRISRVRHEALLAGLGWRRAMARRVRAPAAAG